MERKLIYISLITPDGTDLISTHQHEMITHKDKNGKSYMIDGGQQGYYYRCSTNGDEQITKLFLGDFFELVRRKVFRTGFGKPESDNYGIWRITTLKNMTDEHLQASLDYSGVTKGGVHWQLLLEEKLYRAEQEIYIPD